MGRSGSRRQRVEKQMSRPLGWLPLMFVAASLELGEATDLICTDSLLMLDCWVGKYGDGMGCGKVWDDQEYTGLVGNACRATCDQCNISTTGQAYATQDSALRAFYNSTNGAGWVEKTGWNDASVGHCGWRGVICGSDGNVTQIVLPSHSLAGTLPLALTSLTSLSNLNLENSMLSGSVPSELASLTALVSLALSDNSLSGSVPSELASLTALAKLRLHTNSLTGSVASELSSLVALVGLWLHANSLSGSMPSGLASLTAMTSLGLSTNSLSGSVFSELVSLTALTDLELFTNRLSGSVPSELASLTAIATLGLSTNRLSGSMPSGLASLTAMTSLGLSTNSLSGSVFSELASLTALTDFELFINRLSGSVPSELASLTAITTLRFYSNSLSGSVPAELSSLTAITTLGLSTNSLSGSVPSELSSLTAITSLWLYANSLSGSVPSELASLTALVMLGLNINSLSGIVPPSLGSLDSLTVLGLNTNRLSGTLPASLPEALSILLVHKNRFTGAVPAFDQLLHLQSLTVFGNRLQGHLSLPANGNLSVLLAHDNRLSCPIRQNNATASVEQSLVLPGNAIGLPVPEWAAMRDVPFLSVNGTWDQWRGLVFELLAGIVLLFVAVVLVTEGRIADFFSFAPSCDVVWLHLQCTKALACWSVGLLVVLGPVYCTGAHYYECGDAWLSTTLAYMCDDAACEWACAVALCVCVPMAVMCVNSLQSISSRLSFDGQRQEPETATIVSRVLLLLGWVLVVFLFSAPSVVYAASSSLPPDNTLGLGSTSIQVLRHGAGIVLFLTSSYLVPFLSRVASTWAGVSADRSCRLIMATRLVIVLLAPFGTVVVLNQDCFAGWLSLWSTCQQATSFDIVFYTPKAYYCTDGRVPCLFSSPDFVAKGYEPQQLTTHADVCTPDYVADGRCPRAVVEVLGGLLVAKMWFGAFVAPGIALLLYSRPVSSAKQQFVQWFGRVLLSKPHQYTLQRSLDTEMASVVMLLEVPVVLGFCVPVLVPLACLTFAGHTVMFQWSAVPLTNHARPSTLYLWGSIGLGWALVAWIFHEANFHGVWAVLVGAPLVGVGALCVARWHGNREPSQATHSIIDGPDLAVPLLEEGQAMELVGLTHMTRPHLQCKDETGH